MSPATLSLLLDIAERAIAADSWEIQRRADQGKLTEAYVGWKDESGVYNVVKYSDDWDAMLLATAAPYQELLMAKRQEYNAKRRLKSAINRYRQQGAEP